MTRSVRAPGLSRFACASLLATLGLTPATAEAATAPADAEYRIVRWTTADGLPQNTINDIAVLANGELWLATFGGLVRFDGASFKVLDIAADEGLPANRIVALEPEGPDSFLFLTQQGHLGRVKAGRASPLAAPPAAAVDYLEMVRDGSGRVWCRSADGRIWRTDGTGPWEPVTVETPGGRPLRALVADGRGAIWGVTDDMLLKLEGESAGAVPLPNSDRVSLSTKLDGGLWIGTGPSVSQFDRDQIRTLSIDPPFDEPVFAIEPGLGDEIWVGTPRAVSRLERQADGSWRRTPLAVDPPTSFNVGTLLYDGRGSLWIGTEGGGLYRLNPLPTRRFGAAAGLGEVFALASDGQGGALGSTGCASLFHVDASGTVQLVRSRDLLGNRGMAGCSIALARGRDGTLWARGGPSLLRLTSHPLGGVLIADDLPNEEGPIVANSDGSLWVVSRGGSVQRLTPAGRVIQTLMLPAPLMSASDGPDGSLWVGGDGEIFQIVGESVSRFGSDMQVPRGLVRDILARSDGTAWLGTYGGGVGRMRGGRIERLTLDEGLPDNSVSRLLVDDRGRMWISTNRGLAVVGVDEIAAVADGRARTFDPVVLGPERGVPEANFGSPAGFADTDGRLWFGTIDGVVVVDSAALPSNTTPPIVHIDEVRADQRLLPIGPVVTVPPLTAHLRLAFTTFELRYPERIRFRFRFDGIDSDWVNTGTSRLVDWTPPGPGRHRFLVEARNEDGVWSAAPAAIVLDVQPAWWQTKAFEVAVGLALLCVGVVGMWWRIHTIERTHAERLRNVEGRRLAEERLSATRMQLEHVSRAALAGELAASLAHEVRQPIGAIVNNAEAGKRHLAQYLERPADLAQIFGDIIADGMRASEVVQGLRGFLQSSGSESATVDMTALVREMLPLVRRELRNQRVEVELALADGLPLVEGHRVQLGQVVVNLVVNACEALAGIEGIRRVIISTSNQGQHVELTVRDNGPGVPSDIVSRMFEPFVTTKSDGLGVGLAISRTIAERHGGRLTANPVPGGGLSMILTLPATPGSGVPT